MNKDMINIDDFVREKLGVSKEKDDPTAWLKMKDLLDKEMPEKAVPFMFRWGKPMAFLGVALLLGALCVGGYELNAIREKSEANTELASANENYNKTINHSSNNSKHSNDKVLIEGVGEKSNNNTHQEISSNANDGSESISNNKEQGIEKRNGSINSGASNAIATVSKSEEKHLGEESNELQEPINANQSNKSNVVLKAKNTTALASNVRVGSSATKPLNKSHAQSSQTQPSSKAPEQDLKLSKSVEETHSDNSGLSSRSDKTVIGDKVNDDKLQNNNLEAAAKNTSKAPVSIEKTKDSNPTRIIDSIPLISTVKKETVSKRFPKKITVEEDTISQDKIGIARAYNAPASKVNEKESVSTITTVGNTNKKVSGKNSSNKIKVETVAKNNEYAASNTQSKKDNKVEQKKNIGSQQKKGLANFIDKLNLPDAAANAKRDIGNAKFYAGFAAGFNYSLSNVNNFQGIQFGPTGELVFNQHWSLFASIKYFNRSGGKKIIDDTYWKETAADTPYFKSGANWNYWLETDTTTKHFNFSTLHSFELPLTVRYSLHKFYIMTGINLAYYLGVNVEEVKKKSPTVTTSILQTNYSKPIPNEQQPKLSASDFGSKFGLGYVFGLGYQISPAWQADARLVNTFWDNSKGDGAKNLSKDFYKLPSLQLTVGYQFNRGKTKPTFGPTDMP
jgi:hypothetical protein